MSPQKLLGYTLLAFAVMCIVIDIVGLFGELK